MVGQRPGSACAPAEALSIGLRLERPDRRAPYLARGVPVAGGPLEYGSAPPRPPAPSCRRSSAPRSTQPAACRARGGRRRAATPSSPGRAPRRRSGCRSRALTPASLPIAPGSGSGTARHARRCSRCSRARLRRGSVSGWERGWLTSGGATARRGSRPCGEKRGCSAWSGSGAGFVAAPLGCLPSYLQDTIAALIVLDL